MQDRVLKKVRLCVLPMVFLLAAGCADIVNNPRDLPEQGRVDLSIASAARTVSPRIAQFSKIEISFARKDAGGTIPPLDISGGAATIYLPPGTWELTASAYNTADPPAIVAQAANTLTRTGGEISGETRFVLEPTGTGNGTLEYAIDLPAGVSIVAATSRIVIEQNGQVVDQRALSGNAVGEFSLPQGRYLVDMLLDRGNGTTAVYREAAVLLPGLATAVSFAPAAGDFLSPEARAALTFAPTFATTDANSSHTKVEAVGGGGVSRTQRLSVPISTDTAYFVMRMIEPLLSLTVSGADAAKVSRGAADGQSPGSLLEVFTVDMSDLTIGDRTFDITIAEPYKESVRIALTISAGSIQSLYYASLPNKRVYILGEQFDPAGLALAGTYSDGSPLMEPDLSAYVITGFDSASVGVKTLRAAVRGKIASNGVSYTTPGSFTVTVENSDARRIFFDYGLRHSAIDTQPDQYGVLVNKALVLAPVKWHIPNHAVFEWKVDGATQTETSEYFRFTPTVAGNYAVTVTAKLDGVAISTASTTVQCVASSSGTGRSGMYSRAYAPGQFVPGPGREVSESLGGWGGYIIYRGGMTSFKIEGNGFSTWNEPGTVWVMQDLNGNGLPDDTWYELAGNRTLLPETNRRYAVTYTRVSETSTTWVDNLGGTGVLGKYPKDYPSPMTFVGTGLAGEWIQDYWSGYVDVYGSSNFSISNAIQADGTPAPLTVAHFIKVQTGLNAWANAFGEISTEVYVGPVASGSSNPAMQLTGVSNGSGQYDYQFINNSGYSLNVTLADTPEFVLNAGSSVTKTLSVSTAYYDYYGGNVSATKATGKVTFADRGGDDGNI